MRFGECSTTIHEHPLCWGSGHIAIFSLSYRFIHSLFAITKILPSHYIYTHRNMSVNSSLHNILFLDIIALGNFRYDVQCTTAGGSGGNSHFDFYYDHWAVILPYSPLFHPILWCNFMRYGHSFSFWTSCSVFSYEIPEIHKASD